MVDDAKQDGIPKAEAKGQSPETTDQDAEVKSRGITTYALFGAAGVVLIALVVAATLIFVGTGGEKTTAAGEARGGGSQSAAGAPGGRTAQSEEDSLLALLGEDADVLENIMKNLEFLDYQPDADELGTDEVGMSAEDSLQAVNWLEAEKARLAEKEKELSARAKEIGILDKKVSQKLLKLEQAESGRITNLAKLYDGMEARAVAKLMANLDDETVVAILPRMKQKSASQVLSLMPAKRAAKLSKQMITIAEK